MGRTAFTEVNLRRKGYSRDIAKEEKCEYRKKEEKRTKNWTNKEKQLKEN